MVAEITEQVGKPAQAPRSVREVHLKALEVSLNGPEPLDLSKVESRLLDIGKSLEELKKLKVSIPGGVSIDKKSVKLIGEIIEKSASITVRETAKDKPEPTVKKRKKTPPKKASPKQKKDPSVVDKKPKEDDAASKSRFLKIREERKGGGGNAGSVLSSIGLATGGPVFAAISEVGQMIAGSQDDSIVGRMKSSVLGKADKRFGIKEKAEKALVKVEKVKGVGKLLDILEGKGKKDKKESDGKGKARNKEGKFIGANNKTPSVKNIVKSGRPSRDKKAQSIVLNESREDTNKKLDTISDGQDDGFKSVVKAISGIDTGSGLGGGGGLLGGKGKGKGLLGKGKGLLKGGGKALGIVGAVISAGLIINESIDAVKQLPEGAGTKEQGGVVGKVVGKEAGGLGGAAAGAAAGAAIGSIVPVFGTIIGGALGGAAGYFAGDKIGELMGLESVGETVGKFFGGMFEEDTKETVKKVKAADKVEIKEKSLAEARALSAFDRDELIKPVTDKTTEKITEREKVRVVNQQQDPLDVIPFIQTDETLSLMQQGKI